MDIYMWNYYSTFSLSSYHVRRGKHQTYEQLATGYLQLVAKLEPVLPGLHNAPVTSYLYNLPTSCGYKSDGVKDKS